MKRIIITLMCVFAFGNTFAQSDEELITKTVNDFLEGGTNGEVQRFKEAFVRDAVQKAVGSNGVLTMTVESLASKIKPNQKMDRTTKIISIAYANNAATAITETAYATNKILDMLNLLKVGNEWKIVSRVYSRVELDEELHTVGEGKSAPKTKAPAATPKPKKPVVSNDGW